MSLASAIARVNELNTAFAPAAPSSPAKRPSEREAFAGALEKALDAKGASAPDRDSGRARPGTYPHLSGDLDGKPALLRRLEALAAERGEKWHVTSGHRTFAEQKRLWDNRHSNPYPVARPGGSRHESGRAADVTIGGRPIQSVVPAAQLRRFGLRPLVGDAVHVELA